MLEVDSQLQRTNASSFQKGITQSSTLRTHIHGMETTTAVSHSALSSEPNALASGSTLIDQLQTQIEKISVNPTPATSTTASLNGIGTNDSQSSHELINKNPDETNNTNNNNNKKKKKKKKKVYEDFTVDKIKVTHSNARGR